MSCARGYECSECGFAWFQGHAEDCPSRRVLPPLPQWYRELVSRPLPAEPERRSPEEYRKLAERVYREGYVPPADRQPKAESHPSGPACPECGGRSAAPGWRGHAMGCPRFYAKEER